MRQSIGAGDVSTFALGTPSVVSGFTSTVDLSSTDAVNNSSDSPMSDSAAHTYKNLRAHKAPRIL